MGKMKKKILLFLFLLSGLLHADWTCRNGADKLFATPLGAVYKLELTRNSNDEHEQSCFCVECQEKSPDINGGYLTFSIPKKNSAGRFTVIEFRVRAFPALEQEKSTKFRFQFILDPESKISRRYPSSDRIFQIGDSGVELTKGYLKAKNAMPDFEPLSIRLVLDRKEKKVTVSVNGIEDQSDLAYGKRKKKELEPVRSLGIMSSLREPGSGKDNVRRMYFEISDPVVRSLETEAEVKRLPPNTFSPYPYDRYSLPEIRRGDSAVRVLRRNRNPDLIYAWGLRFLYDPAFRDPAGAVELLEEAADDRHVPAMRMLGICYQFGLGVEVDLKKARKKWEEAEQYGFQTAVADQWLAEWNAQGRPNYETKKLRELVERLLPGKQGDLTFEYETGYVLMRTVAPVAGQFFSFKHLISKAFRDNQVSNRDGTLFLDSALSSGFAPAFRLKAYDRMQEGNWKEAEQLLSNPAAGRNKAALPEHLLMKHLAGTLQMKDFTVPDACSHFEDPLYATLYLSLADPAVSDALKSLSCNAAFQAAIITPEKWEKQKRDRAQWTTAQKLAFYLTIRNVSRYNPIFQLPDYMVREAFFCLRDAARQGAHPAARYFLGLHYFYDNFPDKVKTSMGQTASNRYDEAIRLFSEVEKSGFLPAKLARIRVEMEKSHPSYYRILELLNDPRFQTVPEATLLRLRCNYEMKQYSVTLTTALSDAGKGISGAWLYAALAAEKLKKQEAPQYWSKYAESLLDRRKNDIYDPCFPDIYSEFGKWSWKND